MAEFSVDNIVGVITFPQELDLRALGETFSQHEQVRDVKFEPEKNHWLQSHIEPDGTYVAFYRSGRASIAGCNSMEHFTDVAERVDSIMRDLLEYDTRPAVRVSNIVATKTTDSNLDLERLALKFGLNEVEYEPEQFPALIHRSSDHVKLIFSSGKLLCTGLTELDDISLAFREIEEKIATDNL